MIITHCGDVAFHQETWNCNNFVIRQSQLSFSKLSSVPISSKEKEKFVFMGVSLNTTILTRKVSLSISVAAALESTFKYPRNIVPRGFAMTDEEVKMFQAAYKRDTEAGPGAKTKASIRLEAVKAFVENYEGWVPTQIQPFMFSLGWIVFVHALQQSPLTRQGILDLDLLALNVPSKSKKNPTPSTTNAEESDVVEEEEDDEDEEDEEGAEQLLEADYVTMAQAGVEYWKKDEVRELIIEILNFGWPEGHKYTRTEIGDKAHNMYRALNTLVSHREQVFALTEFPDKYLSFDVILQTRGKNVKKTIFYWLNSFLFREEAKWPQHIDYIRIYKPQTEKQLKLDLIKIYQFKRRHVRQEYKQSGRTRRGERAVVEGDKEIADADTDI